MKRSLLFFEDAPYDAENQIFLRHLRSALRTLDVTVEPEKSVTAVDKLLSSRSYCALVMDIMAKAPRDFMAVATGLRHPVPDAQVGIEFLDRCRSGYYGAIYVRVPIFIRSTRGDSIVRQVCLGQLRADGYFSPGREDPVLIEALKARLVGEGVGVVG